MPSWRRGFWRRSDLFAVRVGLTNVLCGLSGQSQRSACRLNVLAPLVEGLIEIRFGEQHRRGVDAELICHPCMRQIPGIRPSRVRQIGHVPRRSIADAEDVPVTTAFIKWPQVDL